MKRLTFLFVLCASTAMGTTDQPAENPATKPAPPATEESDGNPIVEIKTNRGIIKAEIFKDKAPISAANFLKYTEEKYYDGTVFHRVIKGFMIQGGGFEKKENGEIVQKDTHDPIKNEADNGLKNVKGTLAMARTNAPHSATSQFFINVVDNASLNKGDPNAVSPDGYAVFGKVIEGMDVAEKIEASATTRRRLVAKTPQGPVPVPMGDVPVEDVVIESVRLLDKNGKPVEPKSEEKKEAAADGEKAPEAQPEKKK